MGAINITTNGESTFCLSFGRPSYLNQRDFGYQVKIGDVTDTHDDYFSKGEASSVRTLEYLINVKVENNRYQFTWQEYAVKDLEVGDKVGKKTITNLEHFNDYRGVKKVNITFSEPEGDIIAEYSLDDFLAFVTKTNPSLTLKKGNYYTFLQDDASNENHAMVFKNGTSLYETDVLNNFDSKPAGSTGSFTRIKVTKNTPNSLKYSCGTHGDAYGNTLTIEDGEVAILALFDATGEKTIEITGGIGLGDYAKRPLTLAAEYDRSSCDTPENIKSISITNSFFAWHGYGEFAGMKNLTSLILPRVTWATRHIRSLDPSSKIQQVSSGGEMHFVRTFAETKFSDNPETHRSAFADLIKEKHNVTKLIGTFEDSSWNGNLITWYTSKVKDWTNCFRNSAYSGKIFDFSAAEIIDGLFSGENNQWTYGINNLSFPACTSAKRVFQDNPTSQTVNGWKMPEVTSMQGFFQGSGQAGSFYLTAQKCADFSYLLSDTTKFNSRFNLTSSAQAISFQGFFQGSTSFNQGCNWFWDGVNAVSKGTNFKDFFKQTGFAGAVGSWFPSGHVATNISGMFSEMTTIFNPAMSGWDFEPFEDVSFLFADSKASLGYSTTPFTNVLTCEGFYKNNLSFASSGMRNWRFPKCKNFRSFFQNTKTAIPVLDWFNTGEHEAEDLSYMFADANLSSASTYDLTSIKKANYMFLNQSLNGDVMGYKAFEGLEEAVGMFQGANYPGRMRNWRFPVLKTAKNMFKGATCSTRGAYTHVASWFYAADEKNKGKTSVLEDISGIFDGTKNQVCNVKLWDYVQDSVKKANRAFAGTVGGLCANIISRVRLFKNLTEFNEIFADAAWMTDECDLTVMLQDPNVISDQINIVKGTSYTGRWRDEVPQNIEQGWVPYVILPAPKAVSQNHPCLENFQKDFDAIGDGGGDGGEEPEPPTFIGKKNTIYMRVPVMPLL